MVNVFFLYLNKVLLQNVDDINCDDDLRDKSRHSVQVNTRDDTNPLALYTEIFIPISISFKKIISSYENNFSIVLKFR